MTLPGFLQLALDLAFVIALLLILMGKPWRRAGSSAEQESYREMVSTLSVLIREMRETASELDDRLTAKRAELQRALAAADERLAALRESGAAPGGSRIAAPAAPTRPVPAPAVLPPPAEADDDGTPRTEEARREAYRQALDFSRKGWSVREIARYTHLPAGEIELLVKTKGKPV